MTAPLFALYVVWHPSFEGGREIAKEIRARFNRDLYRIVDGGLDVSVLYRNEPLPGASIPLPIDWSETPFTAAVVLADAALIADREWAGYIRTLAHEARAGGSFTGFFPVTVESRGLAFRFEEQAIRWDLWDLPARERHRRLGSDLTHEFCRMVRNGRYRIRMGQEPPTEKSLEKIQVFIGHSKHDCDGEAVAHSIRDWIHENSQLSSFMDVYDIPPGQSFSDVLLHRIETGVLMAVHTDSYSSREWCRREVIEAKRRMTPMVVVDCIRDIDPRSIPYLGNAPVIRMDPDPKDRIPAAAAGLLDEIFRTWLWRYRINSYPADFPEVLFSARPPELISLAALPPESEGEDAAIVYPGPPLGSDEQRLFSEIAPGVRVMTLTKWLEERR